MCQTRTTARTFSSSATTGDKAISYPPVITCINSNAPDTRRVGGVAEWTVTGGRSGGCYNGVVVPALR